MRRLLIVSLVLACATVTARGQAPDPQTLAQKILDNGAKLFDGKDAKVMAATYTEDAVFAFMSREGDNGRYKAEEKRGRADIETVYSDLFKNGKPNTTISKNSVDFARLLAPDLLVIYGTFQPDVSSVGSYPFVQIRVKQGEKWLIQNLRLFLVPAT